MKKSILTLYLMIIMAGITSAQSYHFSQFFSTPLLTNPANTGFTEGPYRLASNFRSQGMQGGNAYFTGYVSADISTLKDNVAIGHKAGLGMYIMNDQSLGGALQTNSIGMSAAYHVGLDQYGDHSIGVGFQGTYNQRRVDYNKLTFENQYGPTGYNPTLPVGEPLSNTNRNFFDVNAGIIYNAVLEDRAFFGGVSVYNILKHKESMLTNEFKMPTRFTVQAGAQYFTGEYGKIYFSATNMVQAKAMETTVGAAYGHQLTDLSKNELIVGMWYRHKDALIPYVGYQLESFQVGLTYDYTVSSIKTAAQVRHGYELTLLYKAIDKRELKTLIPWY
ncbi:MAG TPA: PorP/SprF family type IX secretion system membrane protein [Chitinophagaceae bacterium]|nr:PorP/SprF family type IX secretion system membrane protein [Chitinophagaceae bacterium]